MRAKKAHGPLDYRRIADRPFCRGVVFRPRQTTLGLRTPPLESPTATGSAAVANSVLRPLFIAAPSAKQNGLRMPMVLHPEAGGP